VMKMFKYDYHDDFITFVNILKIVFYSLHGWIKMVCESHLNKYMIHMRIRFCLTLHIWRTFSIYFFTPHFLKLWVLWVLRSVIQFCFKVCSIKGVE
jgi:hypothetical protein